MFTPDELYEIERKVHATVSKGQKFWEYGSLKTHQYYSKLSTLNLLSLDYDTYKEFEFTIFGLNLADSEFYYNAVIKAAKDKEFKNKINNYLEDKT